MLETGVLLLLFLVSFLKIGYNTYINPFGRFSFLMDALIQSLVQSNFAPDRIVPQASMAQYTTLRIGGPARRAGERRFGG